MSKLFFKSLLFAVIMLVFPHCLGAATLSSLAVSGLGLVIGQGVLPPQLPLQFALAGNSPGEPCWVPTASCIVIFDRYLTPSDIGSTFVFGPLDPGFDSAAHFLSNGIGSEWSFSLASSPAGAGGLGAGPALTGDTIGEIDFTINNLVFSQVQLPISTVPIQFGTFTQGDLDVTITVLGTQVPEPRLTLLVATLFLLASCFRLPVLKLLNERFSKPPLTSSL